MTSLTKLKFVPIVINFAISSEDNILYREDKGAINDRPNVGYGQTELVVVTGNFKYYKAFTWSKCGGAERARTMAEAHRKEIADKYGTSKIIRSVNYPVYIRSMIAGFFDGDGHVSISKSGHVTVGFNQSGTIVPEILQFYKHLYGGDINSRQLKKAEHRDKHMLYICGRQALPVLYDLRRSSIIKREQVSIAYQCIMSADVKFREECRQRLQILKRQYHLVEVIPELLTNAYIGGLFDAEGCIYIMNTTCVYISLTQKSGPNILTAINNKWDGIIHNGAFSCQAANAEVFLLSIGVYTIQKRMQLLAALELRNFSSIHHRRRTLSDIKRINELRQVINDEKVK